MNIGVVMARYRKADLDKAIKDYKETAIPAVAQHEGTAVLLVDRSTGDAISAAFYRSEAAAKAFAPKAEKLIESFSKYSAGERPQRQLFEVAASSQQEAKAAVEKVYKAINAHDLEAVARETAADAVLTASGDVTAKGPQGIKEYNRNWITAFPDARLETKRTIVQGNTVVVEAVFVGTHDGTLKTPMGDVPPTGRKVRGDYVHILEVDRGLIKGARLLYDQVQLMTQLGLAPAPPAAARATR